jgi:hypothetical protein
MDNVTGRATLMYVKLHAAISHIRFVLWRMKITSDARIELQFSQFMAKFEMRSFYVCLFGYTYV